MQRLVLVRRLMTAFVLLGAVTLAATAYAAAGGNGTTHGKGEHNGATHSNCGHIGKAC